MHSDFPLRDVAVVIGCRIFDGVFQRDNVVVPPLVQVLDHRGQRRRLPHSGLPGDQDHPLPIIEQLLDDRRKPEVVQALDRPSE